MKKSLTPPLILWSGKLLDIMGVIIIIIIMFGSIEPDKTIVESFTGKNFFAYVIYFIMVRIAYKLLPRFDLKEKKNRAST